MTLRRGADATPVGFLLMSSDITDELRLAAERTRSQYTWSVLESAPDAMVIVNPDGVVQLTNAATETLFGYRREELVGRSVELLIPERYRGRHHGHRAGFFSEPRARAMSPDLVLSGRRKDGVEFPVEISLSPLETEDGVLAIAAIRDVSERVRVEQLALALKYKSEFLANMSHELRTPLNSLLILAGLLQENPDRNLTATQVQYASVIQASGTDLQRLLNDILDLAMLDSGTVTLEVSQQALVEIRDALQREFGPVAEERRLSFAVELADGLPAHIATDPARLHQVLRNLLENAFKFTAHGDVSVHVGRAHHGWSATNDTLTRAEAVIAFSITDTGIGISAEVQQRIFEPFIQGDGTTARTYGGTGLGLSVSRGLAPLLDGEITLTSTLDQGSTFTVYLPTTRASC
jgi:PAS domain S-box-containing protein